MANKVTLIMNVDGYDEIAKLLRDGISADDLKAAFARASAVTREGRPYIIEAVIARQGKGADSTWHPEISIADRRTRKI